MKSAAQTQPGPLDDALALARNGDANAFAGLVRRHESMVFSLALHSLRNREAAEDLAQEVFIELYRHMGQLESEAHVVWWLRKVTVHRCIDELRRPRHRMEQAMEHLPESGVSPPAREWLLEGRLHHLIARLPARARMAVILRYQEELEPLEIARTLEMPVNTVKSHLRRAIAVLRASLLRKRS